MPDYYTKDELITRLRAALCELDRVCDEIVATYLTPDQEDHKKD